MSKMIRFFSLFLSLMLLVTLNSSGAMADRLLSPQSEAACPPLSAPGRTIVNVSSVAELRNAVNGASSNTTILLADDIYDLDRVYLWFNQPNVTLRLANGDREAVVLAGNYVTTEIVQIVASDVTIADLTLREAYYHRIHVMTTGGSDTMNTLIYNVHIIDAGQQAIKIYPAGAGYYPDNVGFLVDLPSRQSFSPDAAFWTDDPPGMKFCNGAPVFAVEVRSENDYGPAAERERVAKRTDYFAAGTRVVWDVDLLSEDVVRVYRAEDPEHPTVCHRGEQALAEPAVPGWSMPVDELFVD
jgi:Uma2 family endonuclease